MSKGKQDIERLRAQRNGHRNVVTKHIKESEHLIRESLSDSPNVDEITDRLQTIDEILNDKRTVLHELNGKILDIIDVDSIEEEIEKSDELNNLMDMSIKKLQRHFDRKPATLPQRYLLVQSQPQVTSPNPSMPQTQQNTQPSNINSNSPNRRESFGSSYSDQNRINAKLPKLTLPKFNGDYKKFRQFWDSFDSSVNRNDNLSNVDKFNYLHSLLEGAAARAIQGFTLTEANYHAACDILFDRFGNTQQIISAHMDELLKLPLVTNDKASHLRYLFDKITVCVRGLEAIGIESDKYGCFLISVIMNKLPLDVRLQIARTNTQDVWEIQELLKTIKGEVQAREIADTIKAIESKQTNSYTNNSSIRKSTPTATSLVVRDNNSRFRIICIFCKGAHYSSSCEDVKDTHTRKQILAKEDRCFLCLRPGHRESDCSGPKRCRNCGSRHQQSICDVRRQDQRHTNADTNSLTQSEHNQPSNVITSTVRSRRRNVLLQTARTYSFNEKDSVYQPVRLLFDTASQRSYVIPKVTKNTSPICSESLNLNTFGSNSYNKKQCDVFNLNLQTRDGDFVKVRALSFPSICSPLPVKINIDQYQHLQGLELADYNQDYDHDTIDILIGADYYWDFVSDEQIRGENGPIAVNSKFGWLLSGPIKSRANETNITTTNLINDTQISVKSEINSNCQLADALRDFWNIESIGISPKHENKSESDNFLENIQFDQVQEKYQVDLPWKAVLPDSNNIDTCISRLYHLRSKLNRQKTLFKQYDDIIKEQLATGIVEIVPEAELDEVETLYLPHHGVAREDRDTTKLRIVFDGSAKDDKNGTSVNDFLLTGPNLTPHVFDVLITFRSHLIGITADIEKAFHQIVINQNDRDMLRFLWFKDIDEDRPEVVHYRFRRLVFGLTSSPAILNSTIQHHLDKYRDSEPVNAPLLSKSLYVDDLSTGSDNVSDGFNIYQKSKTIFLKEVLIYESGVQTQLN